nr:polysaccharide biosynthesis tyrosine autokinase [uncultured Mediterraneibacter sp.]
MSQENYQNQSVAAQIDLKYIWRSLKRNALYILMCMSLVGLFSFVILDHSMSDTYSVSVNLCVIPRDNASEKMAARNVSAAVTRSVNVLNSDTLRDQIEKSLGADSLEGTLTAAAVTDTNMITMSASSTTAENAYKLLKGAVMNYPELSDYFESGYLLQPLSGISANKVQKTVKTPFNYTVILMLIVLAGGVGATILLCLVTDRLHNTEQARHLLDIRMMGSLRYVKKKKGQKALLITGGGTDYEYEEAVDRLVTSLRREMAAEGYKTLMVGSIKENDGKTTVTANLALNLARRGKKVVLVDCDMRHPSLVKLFQAQTEEKTQFSEYLSGNCELEDVIKTLEIQSSPLSFIWQKKPVPNANRMLGSDRFKEGIEKLKEEYDYVIMDTPPLELLRDTEIISETAEAMLMVMRQDEVRAVVVNDTVDLLEENGVTVLGGVLNMTRGDYVLGKDKSGYYKYYHKGKNAKKSSGE